MIYFERVYYPKLVRITVDGGSKILATYLPEYA
jgi:hypothetical protein